MINTIIVEDYFDNLDKLINKNYESLHDSGSVFILYSTEYDQFGNVKHDFLDVIDSLTKRGLFYINNIVLPQEKKQKVAFIDNVKYCIWFAKDKNSFKFNKDLVREKHIWKDVEWGKRSKNYNENGKDPGNVWIPTKDDGKAHITNHIMLKEKEVINKLLLMTEAAEYLCIINKNINRIEIIPTEESLFCDYTKFNESYVVNFKSSEKMTGVKRGQIKTIVTSPPYWNLKNYFKEGQIGQESYEKYISRMKNVWAECFKVLDSSGTLWININIRVAKGNVILIPRDIVNSCKELGFYYKGIIIWHKSSGIPSGKKNISDHHEYVLLFTKSENFHVNFDENSQIQDYKNDLINYGAFWNINRKAGSVGKKSIHPAIYPNKLVERIIELSSKERDYILDPFLGSGTSLIAATKTGRSFIGFEYNENFYDLMNERFKNEIAEKINLIRFNKKISN